ncbi:MAG: HEAT repeat domain-containing protein [Deltaproteobacteria bacterium]|nr:HEAT repeat domain-containing protein [Deltaproteobacteria bacterium]MBW2546166.1 HEAT repeat domain-containing protein [Deltaproteobacteria bacterium]
MRFVIALTSSVVLVLLGSACSKKTEDVVEEPNRLPATPAVLPSAEFVGTEVCASCHESEHADWAGSHHDLAMQKATPETVLGDFDDAKAKYYEETVRFIRDGDSFAVEALGADGKRARFAVIYTFGIEPLQQYLVEVEPGRLQSFLFAWDTRPKRKGGQRWFHLQPDEYIEPGDPLHWTAPSYNWNYACADCHSTAVKKNYDRASKRYSTEYFEINVGCEACHGRGSRHVALVEARAKRRPSDTGFSRRLPAPEKRKWSFVEGGDIAVLATSQPSDELESCAPCHSRRADLGGAGSGYHDRYRLAVLDEARYFDDGQIQDEVYVYGSFLQSKMYAAGVVCSDCHDGHNANLRAEGNALCTRCHKAGAFDGPQHHFHKSGSPGSLCTDCHMPERTYMLIDDRADHRFGLPRPALAAAIGAPDACTGCHTNKSPEWAEGHIGRHFETRANDTFAEVLHAARMQRPEGEPGLVELVALGSAPAIVRATALLELRNLASPALPALLMRAARDRSPIVRRTVAVAARELPSEQRVEVVRELLRDPVRTVRIEAVATLLGIHAGRWSAQDRAALKVATAEYLEARAFNSDRGEGLVDLAHVALLAGDVQHAEDNLREALDIDRTFTAAYVNLADLYRSQQRDEEAEAALREGLKAAADRAAVEFALGLTLIRLGRHSEAMAHLRRAHEMRPEVIRFGYVYAVAQFDQGQKVASLKTLAGMRRRYPASREILQLLAGYSQQMGRTKAAEQYMAQLKKLGESP